MRFWAASEGGRDLYCDIQTLSRPDFGVSISKVFVNYREGEIRSKICHFRGFFYFRWYSRTIIYFRQIFVVLSQDKSFSITFEKDTPQPAGGKLLLNPLTTVFFSGLNDKLGETGILLNCPEGGGRRKGPCLLQRQLKTVKIFVLFNFIYSF